LSIGGRAANAKEPEFAGRERKREIGKKQSKVQPSVMAVTECTYCIGDTSVVNMVRKICKIIFFEPGDTRQQWKGEAAASFVCAGIASS
jgi:hypothetical protein